MFVAPLVLVSPPVLVELPPTPPGGEPPVLPPVAGCPAALVVPAVLAVPPVAPAPPV